MPISVVADDSRSRRSTRILRRQREQWGQAHPGETCARFGVLRRREILGLLVDWGYRSTASRSAYSAPDGPASGPGPRWQPRPTTDPADHDPPTAR
jgi:hypothetical protein